MDRIGLDTRFQGKNRFYWQMTVVFRQIVVEHIYPDSISNNENIYGSHFSSISFKNRYSIYGSPSSSLSPYNPNTLTPPVIYLRGEKIGCLSKNVNLTNRVDPDVLNDWMISQRLFDSFPYRKIHKSPIVNWELMYLVGQMLIPSFKTTGVIVVSNNFFRHH